MKRNFTIFLSLIALFLGTTQAQVVFDPATYDPGSLPAGMSIVDIDGTKYLKATLNSWNTSINLPGKVIVDRHTKFRCMSKFKEGISGAEFENVNTFLKLLTPGWGETICEGGAQCDTVFKEHNFNNLPAGKAVGVLQFAAQDRANSWSAVVGDTLFIGRITIENPYAVIDPLTVDKAKIPASWAVVDVDGTPHFTMVVNGWNGAAWWSIPTFTVPAAMKNLRFYSKYALGGQHSYTIDQIQTWLKWIGGGSDQSFSQVCKAEFQKFILDPLSLKKIEQVQIVGQDRVVWGTVAGDTVYMSVVEPDWPYSLEVTSEGDATTIDTDLGQLQMYASNVLPEGSSKTIIWSVSDEVIASIDEAGLLSAFYDGTVTVTAKSDDPYGATSSMDITLSNQVTGRVEVDTIHISTQEGKTEIDTKGGTLTLEGEVLPENAFLKTFTWSMADDSNLSENEYAKVNKYGLLTAKANGIVTVYARANDVDTVRGSIDITITNQVWFDSLKVSSEGDVTEIDTKGGTLQLLVDSWPENADDTFYWTLHPAGLASIDENHLLTALSDGVVTATLTANVSRTSNNKPVNDKIVLTLSNQIRVASITVMGIGGVNEIPVLGGTLEMVANLVPANASNKGISWSVNDEGIATISEAGLLQAVANGVVEVTATSLDPDGVSGSASITIKGQGTSMEDLSGKPFGVYPNPAQNTLYIENAGSITSFEIIDLDGKLMMRVLNNADRITLDVSSFVNGVYTIRAYQDDRVHLIKFIKE